MSTPPATEVTHRLERLADQAPTSLGDPDRLWTQGRRRRRARAAGTAACLVLLAVLGAVGLPAALDRTQGLVAVAPDAPLRLPDVIRQPGEWEGSFPSAPGPLVAVGAGSRGGWWSSRPALWGVSAATGESRFLDLPDVALVADVPAALSADGQRLAYWFTDADFEMLPADRGADDSVRIRPVGVAVVDLATGDVERWHTDAPYGLAASTLAWAGDVLWWSGGPVERVGEVGTRSVARTHTWDVGTGEQRTIDRGSPHGDLPFYSAQPFAAGFVASDGREVWVVRGDDIDRTVSLARRVKTQRTGPALSPDGARLAAVLDLHSGTQRPEPDPVILRDLDDGPTALSRVGDARGTTVHGWRSSDEVVVGTYTQAGSGSVHAASVVDVRTADVAPLLEFHGEVPFVAAEAWSYELITAPDAPFAPDPRLAGAFVLVVGAFVVSLSHSVRRRRDRA